MAYCQCSVRTKWTELQDTDLTVVPIEIDQRFLDGGHSIARTTKLDWKQVNEYKPSDDSISAKTTLVDFKKSVGNVKARVDKLLNRLVRGKKGAHDLGEILCLQLRFSNFAMNLQAWYSANMNTASTIPLESLSTEEKILLMERLWDELSRRPSNVPEFDWHGVVLAERLAAVREGRSSFVDWGAAKQRLRERLK